ncbi:MAG: sulfatase [Thermoplasmata archaeon]
MESAPRSSPDVFIIVLDCVSADALASLRADANDLPNIHSFMQESVSFENAAASAPWTIPSHASIFMGLHPWNHGLYSRGPHTLAATRPTLAEVLSRGGYRTFSLSGNPFISPVTGLTRGFDTSYWGSWLDLYSRSLPLPKSPPSGSRAGIIGVDGEHPGPRVPRRVTQVMARFPLLPDLSMRLGGMLFHRRREPRNLLSPWIEPTLHRVLSETAPNVPVFGFINLLDAHEPYLGIDLGRIPARNYLRLLSTRQDKAGWVSGQWVPDKNQLARLEQLYHASLRTLDHRVGRILTTLQEFGRLNNTMIVMTSDHGQGFTPNATLYHSIGIEDELLRVPLLIRFPGKLHAGKVVRSWASLVDIMPSILSEANLPPVDGLDGQGLRGLISSDRPEPVFAMSDGLGEADRRWVTGERSALLDRFGIVAFLPKARVEVRFEVTHPSSAAPSVISANGSVPPQALQNATDEIIRIRSVLHDQMTRSDASVHERLAGWGYD